MNPRLPESVLLPLAAGLVQILSGCLSSTSIDPDKSAGGSDEIDTRLAVDRSGHPIAGARIALVKAGDSTGNALAISATGTDGTFPSFVVPDGLYSVLLRDPGDTLGRFVDSVLVVSRKLPSGRDTLLSLGSMRGVVRLGSGDSPTSVTVGLLGTDILANVKADGSFKIELVPGGLYTLGAVTSLDGYGRLYKRIQVADGQNLVLADTLVLPFSGLPVPTGLRVLQDTATGNVKVVWTKVVHPDLLGYVLERVENGTTAFSRYLTDTAWTDSLGAFWEAMPLYGPWPSREVAYRVRSRSLSGSPDSKSVAHAFTARAPEWTKRVDSVKVVMTTDSVTGVTTLKWNTPKHPDLLGWHIEAFANGTQNCSMNVSTSVWNDKSCPFKLRTVVDSTVSQGDSIVRLNLDFYGDIKYVLYSIRKQWYQEEIGILHRAIIPAGIVDWRDSGLTGISENTIISTAGKWIVWQAPGSGPMISLDGNEWESLPIASIEDFGGASTYLVGSGDSLWIIQPPIGSKGFKVNSRQSKSRWISRFVSCDSVVDYINGNGIWAVNGSVFAKVWYSPSVNSHYLRLGKDTAVEMAYPGSASDGGGFERSYQPNGTENKMWYEAGSNGLVLLVDSISIKRQWRFDWASGLASFIGASSNTDGYISLYKKHTSPSSWVVQFVSPIYVAGDLSPKFVNPPLPGMLWSQKEKCYAVVGEELWAILDGHLWKGKLNLPK